MRALGVVVIVLGSVLSLQGQQGVANPVPQVKRALVSRVWLAEAIAATGGMALDGWSTRVHDRWYEEKGSPLLYGNHGQRYWTVAPAWTLLSMAAAWKLERSRSRLLRLTGHGLLLSDAYFHWQGYGHNMSLPPSRRPR